MVTIYRVRPAQHVLKGAQPVTPLIALSVVLGSF